MKRVSVGIIGGGAGGIFSSICLKRLNPSIDVTIYELQERIGKKILQSGNGRCNLSNKELGVSNYNSSFAKKIISEFDYHSFLNYMNDLSLMLRVDEEGRIYPYSLKASTVLDVFLKYLKMYDINVVTNTEICSIQVKDGFILNNKFHHDYIINATGGKSSISFVNKSYDMLVNLGHKVTSMNPSLVALKTKESTKPLSGIRLKAKAKLYKDQKLIDACVGEILFKDEGLSGIAIFMLSRLYDHLHSFTVSLDLYQEKTVEELNEMIKDVTMDNLLGYFPKMINQDLINRYNKNNTSIGQIIKNYEFQIVDTYGYKNAQVTKGGIDTIDIDDRSCESKIIKNLYIIGEALDVDGNCGGYNLHFAFASGYCAARNIYENVTKLGENKNG